MQLELGRNKCRNKRIDVWPQAVDTDIFNPRFRSSEMRERMTEGNPDAPILVYVGRLGAGALFCLLSSFWPSIRAILCGFQKSGLNSLDVGWL